MAGEQDIGGKEAAKKDSSPFAYTKIKAEHEVKEGETLKLPDLLESVLGAAEIEALFRDLAALTVVREIIPKQGPRDYVGEGRQVLSLEDGRETWSYGQYQYAMFSEKDAKDLVVRFNDRDIVESYTFNTTNR